jgi:hypothetical protein
MDGVVEMPSLVCENKVHHVKVMMTFSSRNFMRHILLSTMLHTATVSLLSRYLVKTLARMPEILTEIS